MAATDEDLLTRLNTAMIRLDLNMDHILRALGDMRSMYQDHETRIRLIEPSYVTRQQLKDAEDALNRHIKEVADKPTVSPGTMWKAVSLAVTIAGLFWGIIGFVVQLLR